MVQFPLKRVFASVATAALIASGLLVGGVLAPAAQAADAAAGPVVTIQNGDPSVAAPDAVTKDFILAGEDNVYTVGINNPTSTPWYNLSFALSVPNGVEFVATGAMGSPKVYPSGATLPNSAKKAAGTTLATVPAGSQLWVWEDVADLPVNATYTSTVTVRPLQPTFPVGSDFDVTGTGYASTAPDLKPVFDGSTGVGAAAGVAATVSGTSSDTTHIRAVRITKTQPNPESELPRGVHNDPTVYTLTIENTSEGDTDDSVVVDYLPAGLEFLGCGTGDNTASSAALFDDGTREYPGAPALNTPAATVPDCIDPVSVDTIALPNGDADTDGLAAGVYTKVTWNIGTLPAGTAQTPSTPGVPSTTTIRYRAAVPLFENTLDWSSVGGAPSAESLAQGMNLDNNTGASTRHGAGTPAYDDAHSYLNRARVAGEYAGPVASDADRAASDRDDEVIDAIDVRILKSVDTGAGDPDHPLFVTGQLATYSLDLRTSEYTSADGLDVADTFANGLCPVFPAQSPEPTITGDPFPEGCGFVTPAQGTPAVTGATVTAIDFAAGTGIFTVHFAPELTPFSTDSDYTISYTALMRPSYETVPPVKGDTSSGDVLENTVTVQGTTSSIPALDGVTSATGAKAFGDESVWDDSSAQIFSNFSSISKSVLPRQNVVPGVSGAAQCDTTGYVDGKTTVPAGFVPGDTVCYQLTVDFASDIDVRNPKITDFLPDGVDYVGSAAASSSTLDSADVPTPAVDGKRITWELGHERDGVRYVPMNSTLVLYVWGKVTVLSETGGPVDKPENLMKYQQENVRGEVFFLRDASAIQAGTGASLLKGVESVVNAANPGGSSTLPANSQADPDGNVFDSNRDGISVVQGNKVTYRVDLTGSPDFAIRDLHVWDQLPAGIACDDVTGITSASQITTECAPGTSLLKVGAIDLAPNAHATVTYTVTIPAGVQVDTALDNTASIVSYDAVLDTGETETYYPEGSLDQSTHTDGMQIPGAHTRDDSNVFLPAGTVTKKVVSTEVGPSGANIDPDNGDGDAVQGELVTYEYAVSIPGHTTVKNGILADQGVNHAGNGAGHAYTVFGTPTWSASAGVDTTGFAFCDTAAGCANGVKAGTLAFPKAGYTNATDDAQVFTVDITVYVTDHWNDNTKITNDAKFTSDSWSGGASADVTYREPAPVITKAASQTVNVHAGQTETYTITVSNPAGRPTAFDNAVTDCVPVELGDVRNFVNASGTVTAATGNGCDGTLVTWTGFDVQGGATATLSYDVTVTPLAAGSASYENSAALVSHTLPPTVGGQDTTGRRGDDDGNSTTSIQVESPGISKTVTLADSSPIPAAGAPIGQTVHYTVTAEVPANINLYDAAIIDTLPDGVTPVGATTLNCEEQSDGSPCAVPITGDGSPLTSDGQTIGWLVGDAPSSPTVRVIVVGYDALLSDGVTSVTPTNKAHLAWNPTNGDDPTSVDGPFADKTDDASAPVTIADPELVIAKSVDNQTPQPGDVVNYTVSAVNNGTTDAYNVVVKDVVPTGVVVDESTITGGGVLTGDTAQGGGTITWGAAQLPGPFAVGAGPSFTYSATLAASETISDPQNPALTNTATVQSYTSFPEDGRDYGPSNDATATVTPEFPHLTLDKHTTGDDVAYAGKSFGWSLVLKNAGTGDATTVTVTDVLPENWSYDATSAQLTVPSINGGNPKQLEPSIAVDKRTLTWTLTADQAGQALLAPGDQITVDYTATPSDAALQHAGVTSSDGTPVPHENTLSAVATDPTGADHNASHPYSDDETHADAFIHSADVTIAKTPGAAIKAGESGLGWKIDVKNDGPDAAVGPFTVTDDAAALPAGVTITSVDGGDQWNCTVPAPGFTCESTGTAPLASGDSLPTIDVNVAVTSTMPAGTVENTASVTDSTFDPNTGNNSDDGHLPITNEADLEIVKALVTAAPHAGESITWTLTAKNDGPSVSRSAITVTDTVPPGVSDAIATGDGWDCPTDPTSAGNTITCEYTANSGIMPVATPSVVTLTGTIDSGYTGTIENTAQIVPGGTDDPNTDNNHSTTPVSTPGTDTTLSIEKTQVAPVGVITPGENVTYRVTVSNTGTADARGVKVTDVLPEHLSLVSATGETGTWACDGSVVPGTIVCRLVGTLAPTTPQAPGASFLIVAATDSSLTGDVVNTATAHADNVTSDPSDGTSSGSVGRDDLAITKSHPAGPVVAGTSLDYTLQVSNNGPSDSPATVHVVDTVPAGLVPTGFAADGWENCAIGTPDEAGKTPVSCDLVGGLAAGADAPPITVTVSVPAGLPAQTLVNTAAVSGPLDDTDPSNNTADDPTVVTTAAAVSIQKDVDDGPYIAGTDVGYTLTVVNDGPSVANLAHIVDAPPAGLTVVSMTSDDGWTCDASSLSCDQAVLPLGTSTIRVTAHIDHAVAQNTALENVATLGWTDSAGSHSDDDPADITVDANADLGLVKTAVDADGNEVTEATAGTQLRYLLQASNAGPSDAVAPLTISDQLPLGVTFVSVVDSLGWDCSAAPATETEGQVVDCLSTGVGLAAGASAVPLTLLVQLDATLPTGDVTNTATVSSPTVDQGPTPNTDDATVAVEQLADLAITKTHDGAARIGDNLVFDLGVSNAGPSTATAVTVADTLPAGLQYVGTAASDPAWSCTVPGPAGAASGDAAAAAATTVVTCALSADLAPGADAPALQIETTVLAAAYDHVVNTATVASETPETSLENNTANDTVEVPAQASLVVTKTSTSELQTGSQGTYSITVTNNGPTEDPGPVTVTDALPSGLSFVSASGAGVDCSAKDQALVDCVLDGALGVGKTVTITLTVAVRDAAFPSVTNTATVASPTEQVGDAKLSASVTTTVAKAPPLANTGLMVSLRVIVIAILAILAGIAALYWRRRRQLVS